MHIVTIEGELSTILSQSWFKVESKGMGTPVKQAQSNKARWLARTK
jgi:hypothetical protein